MDLIVEEVEKKLPVDLSEVFKSPIDLDAVSPMERNQAIWDFLYQLEERDDPRELLDFSYYCMVYWFDQCPKRDTADTKALLLPLSEATKEKIIRFWDARCVGDLDGDIESRTQYFIYAMIACCLFGDYRAASFMLGSKEMWSRHCSNANFRSATIRETDPDTGNATTYTNMPFIKGTKDAVSTAIFSCRFFSRLQPLCKQVKTERDQKRFRKRCSAAVMMFLEENVIMPELSFIPAVEAVGERVHSYSNVMYDAYMEYMKTVYWDLPEFQSRGRDNYLNQSITIKRSRGTEEE